MSHGCLRCSNFYPRSGVAMAAGWAAANLTSAAAAAPQAAAATAAVPPRLTILAAALLGALLVRSTWFLFIWSEVSAQSSVANRKT